MLRTIVRNGWIKRAVPALCAAGLLVSIGVVVSGCGPEEQHPTVAPTTATPPGGGDPKEYAQKQAEIAKKLGSGQGSAPTGAVAPGKPGMPGGPGGGSEVPGDAATAGGKGGGKK